MVRLDRDEFFRCFERRCVNSGKRLVTGPLNSQSRYGEDTETGFEDGQQATRRDTLCLAADSEKYLSGGPWRDVRRQTALGPVLLAV